MTESNASFDDVPVYTNAERKEHHTNAGWPRKRKKYGTYRPNECAMKRAHATQTYAPGRVEDLPSLSWADVLGID